MRRMTTEYLIAGRGEAAEAAARALRERGAEALMPEARLMRLLTDEHGVCGALLLDPEACVFTAVAARRVLLADPDADLVFTDRCGIAAAYLAGASMADLERIVPDPEGRPRTPGGLITDAEGRTDVPGLWAAGASAAGSPRGGEEAACQGARCARSMAGTPRPAPPEDPAALAEALIPTGDADTADALAHMEDELAAAAPAPWDLRALQTVCEAQHHLNALPPAPPALTARRLLLENRLIAVRLHLTCTLQRGHRTDGFPRGRPEEGHRYRVRTAMRDGMFYCVREDLPPLPSKLS